MLVFVYGFILWTIYLSFTNSRTFPTYTLTGARAYRAAVGLDLRQRPAVELVHLDHQSRHLRRALYRHLPRARACCSRSCSTRRSAARACCGRSTSTRWRSPSSSPAPPGSGSSIPASASSRRCTHWGWTSFHFDWINEQGPAIYTRRHRRRLAGLGLRHGDVPRRPARHRRRDHQGGADRRRDDAASSTGGSSSRCCGRCSCPPSSSSPTSPSRPTTSSWR